MVIAEVISPLLQIKESPSSAIKFKSAPSQITVSFAKLRLTVNSLQLIKVVMASGLAGIVSRLPALSFATE